MKLIHTADIHLDSPLVGVSDGALRRQELLRALQSLSAYANANGVMGIIVAGDLFDDKYTSEGTIRSVADIIAQSNAVWFVVKGNHGDNAPYAKLAALVPQVRFFGEDWTTYRIANVTVCGRELSPSDRQPWGTLPLSRDNYNIVVLHGDVDDASYGTIDKNALANNPINYVALGHRHSLTMLNFGRVKGCYSGALEARGFDETSPTGFVLIDTDTDSVRFVEQAIRSVVTKRVDISAVNSDIALERLLSEVIAGEASRNYLNLELIGTLNDGVRAEYIANEFLRDKFFALRIKNNAVIKRDIAKLSQEISLRGEFVKLAVQIENPQLRERVLQMGLELLQGD